MPNWCSNKMTIRHTDPAMISRAVTAFQAGALFNEFVPCPADLNGNTSVWFSDPVSQEQIDAKRQENVAKYGYPSWYEFNLANWGTKWDVGGDEIPIESIEENALTVCFDTAWAPPIQFYNELVSQGFEVEAMYNEFGMGFCGEYFDGSDNYIEYGIDDLDGIPTEVDEAFAIRESLEMYAED